MARAEDTGPSLTHEQRRAVVAVALDTNCMPRGALDPERLDAWAKRCGDHGLQLWVPEVVLLEWAEHAASAYDKAVEATAEPRRALGPVGIDVSLTVAGRSVAGRTAVADHVIALVRGRPGVVVLGIDPTDAAEALRDQLLQRRPASTDQGVKTGAGDSAWLRAVHRRAGGHLEQVVVVTGDRAAVRGICDQQGWGRPHVYPSDRRVAEALGWLSPAHAGQCLVLARSLVGGLPAALAVNPHDDTASVIDVDSFDTRAHAGLEDAVAPDIAPDAAEFFHSAQLLSIDRLVGLDQVLVDEPGTNFVAEATFLCTAEAITAGYDDDGDTLFEQHEASNLVLRCTVEAEVADGQLLSLVPDTRTIWISGRDDAAHGLDSGLRIADAALALVPGLEEGALATHVGAPLDRRVGGHHVVVTATVDEASWTVAAEVDGDAVATLRCRKTRRLGWGPWYFKLESNDASFLSGPVNPPWEFAADLLEALLQPPARQARPSSRATPQG